MFELFWQKIRQKILNKTAPISDNTVKFSILYSEHRRSIKTEAKLKVVACIWGEEFIKFLAALAVLPRTVLILD